MPKSYFSFPAAGFFGQTGPFHLIVSIERGQVQAQPLQARLTKENVADILKTNPDGVVYLTKRRLLKVLGHPEKNQI